MEETNFWWQIAKMFFWLPVVILLAYLTLKIGGQYLKSTMGDRRIRVLEKHSLTPKNSLCIVSVDGKTLLLGVSENRVEVLDTLETIEEAELKEEKGAGKLVFAKIKDFWSRGEQP